MSRRGPMSIEDHRAWVAKFGEWTPPKRRPGDKLVKHIMEQLASALGCPEAALVNKVTARVGFTEPERERVQKWARQALTVAVLAAERAGSSGARLSDNVLFHEIALRWSPAYSEALERGPGSVPSEMRRETLEAAREDIKASGLRLQERFAKATEGVAGWYKTRMTANGRRVVLRGKPLSGEALKEARALLGLPPLEREHGNLLRADDFSRKIHRRIETDDPVLLEAQRTFQEHLGARAGRDLLLATPPSSPDLSYVLVADAKVTAEIEYELVRSGPRSRGVVDILDKTRLILNINAARAELAGLETALEKAKASIVAMVQPHRKVKERTRVTRTQLAGDAVQMVVTHVERDGKLVESKTELKQMKRVPREDTMRERQTEREVWSPPWSTAEIATLEAKRSVEQRYRALKTVVDSLEGETRSVVIRTQHRQAINRRWHPTSFWMEDLPGDSSEATEYIPETYDPETGEIDEGPFDLVTKARGRLFAVFVKDERRGWSRYDKFEGVHAGHRRGRPAELVLLVHLFVGGRAARHGGAGRREAGHDDWPDGRCLAEQGVPRHYPPCLKMVPPG